MTDDHKYPVPLDQRKPPPESLPGNSAKTAGDSGRTEQSAKHAGDSGRAEQSDEAYARRLFADEEASRTAQQQRDADQEKRDEALARAMSERPDQPGQEQLQHDEALARASSQHPKSPQQSQQPIGFNAPSRASCCLRGEQAENIELDVHENNVIKDAVDAVGGDSN